jgi:twinkle protein
MAMKSFADFGIDTRGKASGNIKTRCPKCADGKKVHDLSVNLTDGVWNCHKSRCGWSGTLKEFEPVVKKAYTLPTFTNNTTLSENVVKWFQGRGISQGTLNRMRIGNGSEWMPQEGKEVQTIQFHYWRGEKLVNTKFRTARKGFKLVSGAELVLYNIDSLKGVAEAIIVEGEMDALSYIEAGFDNVVSVPNGANKNLEYLDNCWEEIKHVTRWLVAVDKDEAGQALEAELVRRFGNDACCIVPYPAGVKDANDLLKGYGSEALQAAIGQAKPLPIQDVIYVDDIREQMRYTFQHGQARGTTTYFQTIDPHFTWKKGEVTLMGGIPNTGKTTMLLQMMLLKSVKEGTKWAVFSPENSPPQEFYNPLIETYIGKGTDPFYKESQMSAAEYEQGMDFVGQHFFYIFPQEEVPTPVYINNRFKELIVRHGVDGVLTDPFNQMDKYKGWQTDKIDQYISDFLTHEKRFAQMHNVYKLIIAHPVKLQKNGQGNYDAPDYYDLHGGSMWFNKLDNILCYHRPYSKTDPTNPLCEFHSQKIKKQKLVGLPGSVELTYDRKSNRFKENGYSPFELIGTNQHHPTHPAQLELKQTETLNEFRYEVKDAPF